ncbi:MAG: hypothetical protein ACI4M5_06465 [Christensenellales bacterium]
MVLVSDNQGTTVLLIEGRMNKDCRELVDRYLDCRRLHDIDVVAIANVGEFSAVSADYLVRCMQSWQCDTLCLYGAVNFFGYDVSESDTRQFGSIFVDVSQPQFVEATVDGVKISLSNTNTVNKEADIVVDPPTGYAFAQGKYGVSDEGYVKGMKNYLPSQFTFRIKNANIIKDYTWGFIG